MRVKLELDLPDAVVADLKLIGQPHTQLSWVRMLINQDNLRGVEELETVNSANANQLPSTPPIPEIDRNARAYGWEIGRGKSMTVHLATSDENPFLEENWRAQLEQSE